LDVINKYEAKGEPPLTMEIAAEVFDIKFGANGDQLVNDAQHVAVKRALEGLRRKGLVVSRTVNRLRGYGLEWSTPEYAREFARQTAELLRR
jgi:hypothetical protein